jgi:hypothetical protein
LCFFSPWHLFFMLNEVKISMCQMPESFFLEETEGGCFQSYLFDIIELPLENS